MSESKAVFLSYASEDADAAGRICEALRAGGIEVWFDRSELRGGDAWDAAIRRQIKACALFVPIVSRNTRARDEGYFRLEWKLAIDRSHLMAASKAFLLPVAVDGTREDDESVPDRFRDVQWTRLAGGETPPAFVDRVRKLLASDGAGAAAPGAAAGARSATQPLADSAPRQAAARPRRRLGGAWKLAFPALAIALAAAIVVPEWQQRERARNVLLPKIQEITSKMVRSNSDLLDMALEVERTLPGEPALARLWPTIATTLTIETDPPGAAVFWKDYENPAAPWRPAGATPLKDAKVPLNLLRVEIRKEGYQTIELASPRPYNTRGSAIPLLKLDAAGKLPAGMVRIPASSTDMPVVGLERYAGREVPEFFVDRFEVTNRQFKAFVEAGGYANADYWRFPILDGARTLTLAAARSRFKDRTGLPGPATWMAGTYPEGTGEHPVTGVSWYEAAAYAAYAGKQLPTAFHWAQIADTARTEFLVPFSNFGGKSTSAAGSLPGLSAYGVYDIAGNAREWIQNAAGDASQHYILGGGWNDPTYMFNDSFTQPALDRSDSNGFRCVVAAPGSPFPAGLAQALTSDFRDYAKEKPVDDATFALFARQFRYDRGPLDAKIEDVVETEAWRLETVSINAAYNGERMRVHVYLPPHAAKPLQPVVYFPGSNVIYESRFDPKSIGRLEFVVSSGRALVFPIYKGTLERQDGLKSDMQGDTVAYKEHVIMWARDLGRTIDYLETRKDMESDRISYLGISWGGFMGGILPAVEKRIKAVVLNVGGMEMTKALPEVDQINYLPHVVQPVLMLNGEYDMYFPVETSQKPLYRLLGTPKQQKKMLVYASGHRVPPVEFMRETLAWLDAYVGPAQ